MKYFITFVILFFLALISFSQVTWGFKSQYKLLIAGRSFNLEYCIKGSDRQEFPDPKKFEFRANSCESFDFCLIDSITLSDLDSILCSEIEIYKADVKLTVSKIKLMIVKTDGKQCFLISNRSPITRRKRIKFLNRLSSGSKFILRSFLFNEGKIVRMIVSNTGWIVR